jgi:hypothetical protein
LTPLVLLRLYSLAAGAAVDHCLVEVAEAAALSPLKYFCRLDLAL